MRDLADELRDLVARNRDSAPPPSARTTRTIDSNLDSARSTRTSQAPEFVRALLSETWTEEALFMYEERLAIADHLGMDTSPGSPAEVVALREADRAMAGVPFAWPQARGADAIDLTLGAFAPAFGRLTFVRFEGGPP